MNYVSQSQQDKFADEFFGKKQGGVFLDIGAGDGEDINNSLFLERERGWTGLCVEPHPGNFEKLVKNRKCLCENYAVDTQEGEQKFLALTGYPLGLSGLVHHYNQQHKNRINHEVSTVMHGEGANFVMVKTTPLQPLLDKHNLLNIDFCSIDVEGAELAVLQTIDFTKTNIKLFIIENNYNTTDVSTFLASKGYRMTGKLGADEVFEKI